MSEEPFIALLEALLARVRASDTEEMAARLRADPGAGERALTGLVLLGEALATGGEQSDAAATGRPERVSIPVHDDDIAQQRKSS